mmetsp:Transcript_111795/g.311064  ORF Transcript_111795/g.311064 Transcript_111795/m.311064 type:complete len:417 (-) Transcript_111795:137-1387(-)|eukprot:CAMPEP_0179074034 /NCGR_PEP_ID=MMETSP0796-20121207/32878_1 /TAXON_ID=73915 /ORGANISM="Pyrodinium bahamense, Strain pbaha01" /LENGTH=416 /DNA_ID=CAMNT_0020771245 /DNA_START=105 /DNA_END=1355 /DNA_ORIENTATION=-
MPRNASDVEAFFNIVNLYMGVGVLSLPWSFAGASMLGGVIITGIGVLWCAWTNIILVTFAERAQQFSLGTVLGALPGGWFWKPLGTVVLLGTNFLCLVGYIVVFADNVDKVVLQALLGFAARKSARFMLIALSCAIVFPLCLLDQSRLSVMSKVSVMTNWYICFVMFKTVAMADELPSICMIGWGTGDLTMLAVITMAVAFQQCILSVYQEMENRRVGRFIVVQLCAMVMGFVLLSSVSISGYLLYGEAVASNVLVDLPPTFMNVLAQAAIVPVAVGIYPQQQYPISTAFNDIFFRRTSRDNEQSERLLANSNEKSGKSAKQIFVLICVIVASGLVAATGVDLGPLNNASGILFLGWCTVAMPGLAYNYLLRLDGKSKVFLWLHLVVGAVLTVMTLAYQGNHLESIENHCTMWWPK